jgi:hypothetical protein
MTATHAIHRARPSAQWRIVVQLEWSTIRICVRSQVSVALFALAIFIFGMERRGHWLFRNIILPLHETGTYIYPVRPSRASNANAVLSTALVSTDSAPTAYTMHLYPKTASTTVRLATCKIASSVFGHGLSNSNIGKLVYSDPRQPSTIRPADLGVVIFLRAARVSLHVPSLPRLSRRSE